MKNAREKNYTKHISAVISEEDYRKILKYKKNASEDFRMDFSMGDVIRSAIHEFLRNEELTEEQEKQQERLVN